MEWAVEPSLNQHASSSKNIITSPLSDVKISEVDPETGETTRRVCPECRRFIETNEVVKRGGPYFSRGVGDPIYFIGAGVNYRSLIVPIHGRVAFHDWSNWEAYRDHHPHNDDQQRFSYNQKNNWKDEVGVPFPYEFFE
jgi:hypothetical protein